MATGGVPSSVYNARTNNCLNLLFVLSLDLLRGAVFVPAHSQRGSVDALALNTRESINTATKSGQRDTFANRRCTDSLGLVYGD